MWIEIISQLAKYYGLKVTSYAEVWIEMRIIHRYTDIETVTSYAEVWIEINGKKTL